MTKRLSFTAMLMGLLMITFQASAQFMGRVDEPIQTTYVNAHNVDLAGWLRVYPADRFYTEIVELTVLGNTFAGHSGMEVIANGRLIARLEFSRFNNSAMVRFPVGTRIGDVFIRIDGELYVERVMATIIDRRWQPTPQPIPPRYPAPIPPRPIPPRYPAPAPRPMPPRHPAPAPRPPRHEPAPAPRPPRYEPAPRPTPPRVEPGPRPGQPRPGGPGPGPRPGQPRPGGPGPRR